MTFTRLDVVPDTAEWLELRRQGFGASDSAAVLGLSKWATPWDIYKSKHGQDREFDPLLSWVGHAHEPTIAAWIEKFHPEVGPLHPGFAARSDESPWLFATPDRVLSDGRPVELKSAMEYARADWDDMAGGHKIPLYYQVQVQQQIYVLEQDAGVLAVMWGGREFHLFHVARDETFIRDYLIPRTREAWERVQRHEPPAPVTLGEVAEKWPSFEGKTLEASEAAFEAAERRAVLLSDMKAQKDEADALQLAIGTYMEDADTLTRDGRPILTYKTQRGRKTVPVSELEARYPDVAAELVREGAPFKVMRYKKNE